METIRIAVIGAGTVGERHCRVCANLPRADFGKTIARNTEFGA